MPDETHPIITPEQSLKLYAVAMLKLETFFKQEAVKPPPSLSNGNYRLFVVQRKDKKFEVGYGFQGEIPKFARESGSIIGAIMNLPLDEGDGF